MYQPKLIKAPLQEVIFEVFWHLPLDEGGFPHDPGFQLAQGVFAKEIQKEFPIRKRLIPENLDLKIYPSLVYQFWKDNLTWPLVQFGPGLLTVNDTDKNYIWADNFLPNIQRAIQILKESYSYDLHIDRIKLQYIDAVELDISELSAQQFIEKNLKVSIQNNFTPLGAQKSIFLGQSFELEEGSILRINIQNGTYNKTGNDAIIWITSVEKKEGLSFDNIGTWLNMAHKTASDTFVEMLNPSFYDSFKS